MPRSATITVRAALLKWARESGGLSVAAAAKKLGVKPSVLTEWERTEARPTVRQLERLADAVKRPLSAFFLTAPPDEPRPPDFRVPPSEGPLTLTSPSLLAIRRARRLQEVYRGLAGELGEAPTALPVITRNMPPEDAAAKAREAVGVALGDQTGWKDPRVALKVWRSRLEGLGVLVFQFAMPPDEVSGFSLSNGVPAVVLNRKDWEARRVFTLFHEWAHVLLGEAGLCKVVEGYARESDHEVFCNAFAAALLVPMRAFMESMPLAVYRQGRASLEDAAAEGAKLFSVSRWVVLRRFLTAQVISQETYRRVDEGWRKEPRRPRGKAKGGAPPYAMSVSELGPRFVSRVLTAHDRGLIGDGDVADYLSLRLKHLDRVQELLPVA